MPSLHSPQPNGHQPDAPQCQECTPNVSAECYRLAVEGVKDFAIFLMSESEHIASWNEGAERLFGYSAAEAIGQSASFIFTPEDCAQGVPEQEAEKARIQGRAEDVRWHRKKDGSLLWANGVLTRLKSETGEPQGYCKILIDATDKKRAEEERETLLAQAQSAQEEAERASRAKDKFIALVSHELRSPLSAIKGWAGLLGSGGLNEETQEKAFAAIKRNVSAQERLINDLLDYERLTTGKVHLEREPLDLLPLAALAIENIRPQANDKGISTRVEVKADLELVLGDAHRLEQILLNLLSNAVKFTPQGGQIVLELGEGDNDVYVAVKDNGIGISHEFLPHVFEQYHQEHSQSNRRSAGLGLGLSIVRELVELHGGTIEAHSPGKGQGSTFIVKLPSLEA